MICLGGLVYKRCCSFCCFCVRNRLYIFGGYLLFEGHQLWRCCLLTRLKSILDVVTNVYDARVHGDPWGSWLVQTFKWLAINTWHFFPNPVSLSKLLQKKPINKQANRETNKKKKQTNTHFQTKLRNFELGLKNTLSCHDMVNALSPVQLEPLYRMRRLRLSFPPHLQPCPMCHHGMLRPLLPLRPLMMTRIQMWS